MSIFLIATPSSLGFSTRILARSDFISKSVLISFLLAGLFPSNTLLFVCRVRNLRILIIQVPFVQCSHCSGSCTVFTNSFVCARAALTIQIIDVFYSGGNSKTAMIAALSPACINYEETLSTLRSVGFCEISSVDLAVVNISVFSLLL